MRCSLCPGQYKCIEPTGPTCDDPYQPSPALFIGEAPGKDEEKNEMPFCGKTGQEVNDHYLPLAGTRRKWCRFTNAIRCWPATSGHKLEMKDARHLALLDSCARAHLYPEIEQTQPKLIVPMGAFACRAIDPEINLEMHHGFPVETRYGIAFPMYHPAQGIHEPKKMLLIRTDWIRLREYMQGKLHIPEDECPNPDYQEATEIDIRGIDPTVPMGADTESSRSLGPWCITWSQYPGHGRLIRSTRADHLAMFQKKLDRWEAWIDFHHWLHDWSVVEQMSLDFTKVHVRDTMVTAFQLGNLPQGLKALAYRELGMEMTDYEDVVKPYSRPHVISYYRDAYQLDWPKPDPVAVRDDKTNQWKMYRAQSMKTKLKRFFTDFNKNPDKDVYRMWTDNWVDSQELMEERLGMWPGMDIAHVPFEIAKAYACRDSDATGRLRTLLDRMMKVVRKLPQEQWRTA